MAYVENVDKKIASVGHDNEIYKTNDTAYNALPDCSLSQIVNQFPTILSAYYKAKAELGNILNIKVELENKSNQNPIRLNTLMNWDKLTAFDIDTVYTINKDLHQQQSIQQL